MYFDNILIYSQTEEEYGQYISQILQTLQDSNLQVKLKKSIFYINKVEYLGYVISEEEVKMDLNKIYIISE